MSKTIMFIFSVLLFLMTACIKDMGTYSYTTEPDDITISSEMFRNPATQLPITFTQEMEVIIPLKYTINDPHLTKSNLSFTWYLGNEIVSNEETLNLGYMAPASYYGVVVITDNRYGMDYSGQFAFTVTPVYTDGWAVLSDDGLKSELGYLQKDPNTGEFKFIADVYGKANDGKTLASGSGPLIYHYYNDMAPQTFGLTVMQPGQEGPVDLNANDMTILGKIKENFIGEIPVGDFRDMSWNKISDMVCAVSGDGQLYFREEYFYDNEPVPFAAKFSSPYVMDQGYDVTHMINTIPLSPMMISSVPYFLCYDEMHSRMLTVWKSTVLPFSDAFYTNGLNETHMPGDPGFDGTNIIPDIYFPGPEDLSDYEVLKVIACGFDIAASWVGATPYMTIVMFLRSKSSPEDIYLLSFDYWDTSTDYGIGSIDIDLQLFYKWPQDVYPIDPETMIIRNNLGNYHTFYFTGKDNRNIYYFDTSNAFTRRIYSSDTEITAYRQGEVANGFMMYGIYYQLFVVGDASGKLTILDMTDVPGSSAKIVDEIQTDAGKITNMEFLPNNIMGI